MKISKKITKKINNNNWIKKKTNNNKRNRSNNSNTDSVNFKNTTSEIIDNEIKVLSPFNDAPAVYAQVVTRSNL